MDKLKVERYQHGEEFHRTLAKQAIKLQTAENPQMLPFSMESFEEYPLGVVAHNGRGFAGFNAVTTVYPGSTLEIGALYVSPGYRGKGVVGRLKEQLFQLAAQEFPEHKALVFANPNSTPINEKLGFRPAELAEVPGEALKLCGGCSNFSKAKSMGKICCDNILVRDI